MFEGSMVALITPFDKDGDVDEEELRRLVRFQEDNGTDVLVPCGTTGESATLTHEEHENVIEIVVDAADEAKVLAGTGSNSTHEAIRFTKHAEEVGCDGGLVITPYYNKPPQRGMADHFRAVADAVELDLVLYNVPSRTGINLDADTVVELSKMDNIVGVKEASGDVNQVSDICVNTPEDFAVLSGDDSLTLPILSVGGDGVISVVANIIPDRVSDMVRAWQKANEAKSRKIHQELFPLMRAMFLETNPIPVKFAASRLRLCNNRLRSPMTELDSEHENTVIKEMKRVGLSVDE